MIKTCESKLGRLRQGDIIQNVEYLEYTKESNGVIEVSKIVFPYVIILTQDCDLLQDYNYRNIEKNNEDKYLLSVLVAPLYNYEHVCDGNHLTNLGINSSTIDRKRTSGKRLRQNQTPRYHYLEFESGSPLVPSVIDFKHYFAVSVEHMNECKEKYFVCSVTELYREDILQRFASFLSRIGLPELSSETNI
jgi:hypothetical protein